MNTPLTGVVPVVPTIFHDDESVDLGGTARVVDYLLDAGVDGLCLLANYSEQFSLTDAERDAIARTLLERVAGRLPVIVTTSHYSARVAAERSRAAQDVGAAMVMIMPPFFGATLTVAGPAVIEYFRQVADVIDIPVMVQDAPLSSTPLPVSLLTDLVRHVPQVQYAKIEVPQAADKLHALVSALGSRLPGPFDGEESVTLIPDLDAGATGTMPSSTVPRRARPDRPPLCRGRPGQRRRRLGRPAASHPFRESSVRPARAEDPAGRGRHRRLGPDASAVRAGVAQDPSRADRAGRSTRPADHALGTVTTPVIDLDQGWRTERLDLEPLTADHAAELAPVLDDAALHEFIGGAPLPAAALAQRYARLAARRSPDGHYLWGNWVMRVRDTGNAIGTMQVTMPTGGPAAGPAEVAWVVGVQAQGRGYAKEAACGLVALLLEAGWTVVAHIHPAHLASQRVARAAGLSPTEEVHDGEVRWIASPAR
jgi:2-keto-3-deoxy-L-arabinonate dehydratase